MSGNPAAGPRGIFISYRRDDVAGYVGWIYERLVSTFGPEAVYLDVAQEPGIDWEERILERLRQAKAFLAVIGPRWLDTLTERSVQAKYSGAVDHVEREIELALRPEWPGTVIPVLVDTAMPGEYDLPRMVRGLHRAQATGISLASFEDDVKRLIKAIEDAGVAAASRSSDETGGSTGVLESTDTTGGRESAGTIDVLESASPAAPRPRRASSVPAPTDDHYLDVIDAMGAGTVVPWLGTCVRGDLPDSRLLAGQLAGAFPELEIESSDLAEVAQTIAMRTTDVKLRVKLSELINRYSEPIDIHRFLAEFPGARRGRGLNPRYQLIVSTNYDRALERAFERINEPFDYAIYKPREGRFVHFPWQGTEVTVDEPSQYQGFRMRDDYELGRTVIVKLHGAFSFQEGSYRWSDDYVVTEDQYIDYLSAQAMGDNMPVQIRDMLLRQSCLFLGHPLREWSARVLLRRLWLGTGGKHAFSWAIEHEPDDLEMRSWFAMANVNLLNAHPSDYVRGLTSALKDRLRDVAPAEIGA